MSTAELHTKKKKKVVILPALRDYIIQPNRITNAVYDYNLIQERLFNCVMYYLQEAVQHQLKGESFKQLTIWQFSKENSSIRLLIPLKEISSHQNYDYVKQAIKQLASIVVEVPYYNEEKKAQWLYITGLLKAKIPEINNYSSNVEIYIENEVAKFLIEIEKNANGQPIQYTRYIYQIAQAATNKYTSRIYKKISSYKQKGGFTISIEEFRKWLCIENSHKNFSQIKQKILIPVQEELYEKADCWFNCKVHDFTTKKGKKVTHLNFKIITPDLIELDKQKKDYILNMLRMHFGFEEKHFKQIEPIFSKADNVTILEKIGSLREYCMDNSSKITDITGYTVKALLNKFNCPTLF